MKRLRSLAMLVPVGALTLACGSLGDDGKRAPLAVIDGQLTQASTVPSTATSSNVRIAVVWSDGKHYIASQDIPATPVFPSKFHLELTDPPPAAAMNRGGLGGDGAGEGTPPATGSGTRGLSGGGLRLTDKGAAWPADLAVALGTIVAYDDKNGNGKLDLVDEDASSYLDGILGANQSLGLIYVEGSSVPDSLKLPNGTKPSLGYGLLRFAFCAEATIVTPGEKANEPPCNDDTGWLPPTTLYELPLTAEPKFASFMCKNGGGGGGSEGVVGQPQIGPGPSAAWPAKSDEKVKCAADGKSYLYQTCTPHSQGLCKDTITDCRTSNWTFPGTTPPAEWPCTVAP